MTLYVDPQSNKQPESKNMTRRLCPQGARVMGEREEYRRRSSLSSPLSLSSSPSLQSGGVNGPRSTTICSTSMDDTNNTSRANLFTFPWLLHSLLETAAAEGFDHIVSWLDNNASFRVHEPALFVKQVMPRFFKRQSKYKSFQRQLNMWQFERVIGSRGPRNGGYFHRYFKRNDTTMFHLIQRSKLSGSSLSSSSREKSCLFSAESICCDRTPQVVPKNNFNIHHHLPMVLDHKANVVEPRILPPHHHCTPCVLEPGVAYADIKEKVTTATKDCSLGMSTQADGVKWGRSLLPSSLELIQDLSSCFSLDKDTTSADQDGVVEDATPPTSTLKERRKNNNSGSSASLHQPPLISPNEWKYVLVGMQIAMASTGS